MLRATASRRLQRVITRMVEEATDVFVTRRFFYIAGIRRMYVKTIMNCHNISADSAVR